TWRSVDFPTPDAPTTATSSPSWTVRSTPLRTRTTSPPARYSFSTPSATVRGTRSPSLIAEHVHGVKPRGLARRIERREKRQDEGRDGDERDVGRVHLHREVGDLVDVPRNLDDVVAVLDESDGPPQEGANERADEADEDALGHEHEGDAPRSRPEGPEDADLPPLLRHHQAQVADDGGGRHEDDEGQDHEH